jgi:hypothetical protein
MWSPRLERPFTLWRHIRRERRLIRKALDFSLGPVVVYSHPKTASRAIEAAIKEVPGAVPFHVHVLQPRHFTWRDFRVEPPNDRGIAPDGQPAQWAVRSEIVESERSLNLISMVRDPVAVSVSWFFFGLQRWFGCQQKPDPADFEFDELCGYFHDRFAHDGMLNWFEDEWNVTTGVDVYSVPFDRGRGWHVYRRAKVKALVLSAHLSDEAKAEALVGFVDQPVPVVPRVNEGRDRSSPEIYGRLQESIRDNSSLVDRLLGSQYTRHFFSEEQIEGFRNRWLG